VSEFGLGSVGATLAARLLGLPFKVVVTNQVRDDGNCYFWRVPADTQPDTPYTFELVARWAETFPYGFNVAPDEPV